MRAFLFGCCLFTATAWAADRDISLREGEKRTFSLPGVQQVAIDDAAIVEGTGKGDQLTVIARHTGLARILVLLKNDQWVTFKVKVTPSSDLPEGPVPEALPDDGMPLRLKVGEARVFETPGIQKMPVGAQNFEAKVTGKLVELRGVSPGRSVLELVVQGGKRLQVPVVVEGERNVLSGRRADRVPSDRLEVPVSGELLLKGGDVEAVQVEDDEVAEVRIVSESRVVVRGLQEGETVVNVKRGGKVFSHAITVVSLDGT